jgi:putative transposase
MSRDSTVIPFRQPGAIDDPLTEVAREGARRMLTRVLIAEADAFVAQWKDLKLPDGRDRVVRHGHGPQRAIQTDRDSVPDQREASRMKRRQFIAARKRRGGPVKLRMARRLGIDVPPALLASADEAIE